MKTKVFRSSRLETRKKRIMRFEFLVVPRRSTVGFFLLSTCSSAGFSSFSLVLVLDFLATNPVPLNFGGSGGMVAPYAHPHT